MYMGSFGAAKVRLPFVTASPQWMAVRLVSGAVLDLHTDETAAQCRSAALHAHTRIAGKRPQTAGHDAQSIFGTLRTCIRK